MEKISDKYKQINLSDYDDLAKEIASLASIFVDHSYYVIELEEELIGLCGSINTYARSKSAIQRVEPVIIAIHKTKWETIVPFTFSDDPKFPFNKFAHVNYQHGKYPPTFCLSRENMVDWYSEHTLKEYVELVAQWLRDAAKGELMKIDQNDEFEAQRLHHSSQHVLLRASYMDSILENQETQCLLYPITYYGEKTKLAYGNEQDTEHNSNAIGVRLFAGSKCVDDTWYDKYPETLEQLYKFISDKKYPLNLGALKSALIEKQAVYFQIALLRPVKIIDKDTRINYLCFKVAAEDILSDNLNAEIEEVSIIDFTDFITAHYLSETPINIQTKKICILGCGAVGSKVAFHLYRSGISFLRLVDTDILLPHNMVRHALTSYNLDLHDLHKASILKKELDKMFFVMPFKVEAYNEEAVSHISKHQDSPYDLIIDATASVHVMYGLDSLALPQNTSIVRVALSEGGNVGVTYINLSGKQPLADFYMEILRASRTNLDIYHWLSSERKNSTEEIRIGEGCHSNTMRISDDTISAHASLMSSIIRHIYEGKQTNRIILSFAHRDFPGSMQTSVIPVSPYLQFACENDSNWTVRVPKDILSEIQLKTKISGKKETGGYLFGHIDKKRKIIYVLVHFTPKDSKGYESRFRLGTSGLKDFKQELSERSIGQIEYIGDWHSHPSCDLVMSDLDIDTSEQEVLPKLKDGIGICSITKTSETKFYLLRKEAKPED